MEKILVHDSDKEILDLLTTVLEMEGFIVYPLLNCGDDFIGFIHEHRPHVVVLDYRLEGKVCREALKQIKESYPHLPVIAISCNSNIDEIYKNHGFSDYIKKPFDLDILYSVLRKHLDKKSF